MFFNRALDTTTDPAENKNDQKKIFYVRWGGIPNWDPKTQTLKKAHTWGMGSGGLCLTSLHENKIRDICFLAVGKHNNEVIEKIINAWMSKNLDVTTEEVKEFNRAVIQYQIMRFENLAKGQQLPEFLLPATASAQLKDIAQKALSEINLAIDKESSLINSQEATHLSKQVIAYQIARQRNLDIKPFSDINKQDNVHFLMAAYDAVHSIDQMILKMQETGIFPLFYTENEYQQFYYEYCNKRLWPLSHRHIENGIVKDIFDVAPCDKRAFEEYMHMSIETARAVAKKAAHGSLVWFHDYHLLLVPEYLKEMRPDLRLGYHFHVPVPDLKLIEPLDDDIKRLFTSVMYCHYLSFNTQRDLVNCKAIVDSMGLNTENTIFERNPIGTEPVISFEKDHQPNVKKTLEEIVSLRAHHAKLEEKSSSFQVIFSVDRIEPSKGLKVRLKAILDILESDTGAANNLLFVMVCPDSRTGIKAYDDLNKWFKEEIQRLNELSNKKIGRDIIKFHGEMPQSELQALGQQADVFMVTSDADGLHLGPVEWVATQNYHNKDKQVNLILSKGAGISEYFNHAMTFYPGDCQQLTAFLREVTTESSVNKAIRSDNIKHDFFEGEAHGFSLTKWHENAAKGLEGPSKRLPLKTEAENESVFVSEPRHRSLTKRLRGA